MSDTYIFTSKGETLVNNFFDESFWTSCDVMTAFVTKWMLISFFDGNFLFNWSIVSFLSKNVCYWSSGTVCDKIT